MFSPFTINRGFPPGAIRRSPFGRVGCVPSLVYAGGSSPSGGAPIRGRPWLDVYAPIRRAFPEAPGRRERWGVGHARVPPAREPFASRAPGLIWCGALGSVLGLGRAWLKPVFGVRRMCVRVARVRGARGLGLELGV